MYKKTSPLKGGRGARRRPWSAGSSGKPSANGIATAQKGVTPRRGAHGASEPTRDVVGLGNPIDRCLATTGRGNRRWDGGKLAMTQDARDDRLLGHGGNNAERAASAQGTGGHVQRKHAPQEPGPAPGRWARLRLIPIPTLLARRWDNRLSQLAVRRQTPRRADEVDARQGDERRQLLSQFQRRQCHAGRAIRPRVGERVHAVS